MGRQALQHEAHWANRVKILQVPKFFVARSYG
jgi:hypothetical protein